MPEFPPTTAGVIVTLVNAPGGTLINLWGQAGANENVTWKPACETVLTAVTFSMRNVPAAGESCTVILKAFPPDAPTEEIVLFSYRVDETSQKNAMFKHETFGFGFPANTLYAVYLNNGLAGVNEPRLLLGFAYPAPEQNALVPSTSCGIIPFLKGECIHGI